MIPLCSPDRLNQLTGEYKEVKGIVKHVDHEERTIVLQTTDIDLLCWLSRQGELHYCPENGLIVFVCDPICLFGNSVSCLENSEGMRQAGGNPAIEYARKLMSKVRIP